VEALLDSPRRFNDLLSGIPGIAPNMLTHRLRHLERQRLIVAEPYSERPPRSLYELTPGGRELAGAMRLLSDWGARHTEGADAPRHRACGSPLEARWYCPTCGEPVDEGENAGDLYFV
jgi:DNA-binding HxlR family transcriptional regulator